MLLSILLIIYASIALYLGTSYFFKENTDITTRNCLSVYGLMVFMWCFGYGMMSLSRTEDAAYFWRSVGLFGIVAYLLINFVYVRHFTGLLKKGFVPVMVVNIIFALCTLWFVMQRDVVSFFEYNGRMAYSSQPCLGRTLEGLFIAYIVMITLVLGIIMYIRAKYKRTKKAIQILIVSHFAIVFLMIPDTLFPMMGKYSIPTTGFGAFISYMCFLYVSDKQSTFNISSSAINEYIYKYVDSSLLFFDLDGKVLAANNHAQEYLGVGQVKGVMFDTLFDISREDVTHMIAGDYKTDNIGVKIKDQDKRCSAAVTKIFDKYGDPIYYACILNDITSDAKKFEETNSLKEQLDAEVKAKTKEIERLSLQTIETMANTLEAKDEYTKGHSSRVSTYAVMLAKAMGMSDDEVENIRIMALLHDVGKVAIPDRVLNKAGRLEDAEFDIIKSHTTQGHNLLKGISYLESIAKVARHHHERYDGKGYPDRIAGEEIELEARIVGIADSYDAMSSDRVYRRALPKSVIREELVKGRGTQFDPNLLDAFLKMFDEGEFDEFMSDTTDDNPIFNIHEIIETLDTEGSHEGADILTHNELIKVYSYLKDRGYRYGSSFKAVLITLTCDRPEINTIHLEKAMTAMEYSITQYLRKIDLTSRVSDSQIMVILSEADDEFISNIMERIYNGYYKNCLYTEFKPVYEVND